MFIKLDLDTLTYKLVRTKIDSLLEGFFTEFSKIDKLKAILMLND